MLFISKNAVYNTKLNTLVLQYQVEYPNPAVWLPKIKALTRKLEAGLVEVIDDITDNIAYLQMAIDIIDAAYSEEKITEEEHRICKGVLNNTYPEAS